MAYQQAYLLGTWLLGGEEAEVPDDVPLSAREASGVLLLADVVIYLPFSLAIEVLACLELLIEALCSRDEFCSHLIPGFGLVLQSACSPQSDPNFVLRFRADGTPSQSHRTPPSERAASIWVKAKGGRSGAPSCRR